MYPKDADGMANSEGPDQTAQEQSDLGLHCLLANNYLCQYQEFLW